jgi:hypothetical protein
VDEQHQWVIRYAQGPAAQVGPFLTREAATEWAETYDRQLEAAKFSSPHGDRLPTEWHIGLLVHPGSLEWW